MADVTDSTIKVEDFSMLKLIGTGSYGTVVLSKYTKTGEILALKILKKKHLIKKN